MKNAARSAAKEACWRERLQNQAGSGLSVRAFCRREGVSEPSFYSWRRELDKRDRQRTARSAAGANHRAAGLVAVDVVGVLGTEAMLEIAVAGGVVIRLREDVPAGTLQRVLSVACQQRGALATSDDLREGAAAC